jgi:hypothetical protein
MVIVIFGWIENICIQYGYCHLNGEVFHAFLIHFWVEIKINLIQDLYFSCKIVIVLYNKYLLKISPPRFFQQQTRASVIKRNTTYIRLCPDAQTISILYAYIFYSSKYKYIKIYIISELTVFLFLNGVVSVVTIGYIVDCYCLIL